MAITDPHILPADVVVLPVTELDDEVRARLDCGDDAFAVTRPRSRASAKVVDAQAGALLRQFTTPHTIVDAVVAFSTAHGHEPAELLEDAFPMLQRFVDAGILVEAGSERARQIAATLQPGDRVDQWEVVRCIQLLEDVELYQGRGNDRTSVALKIARTADRSTRSALEREYAILESLQGSVSPRAVASGMHGDRAYMVMEWRTGVHVGAAAHELRESPDAARKLLDLCGEVASAYARLHERGILHGDVHERNLLVSASGALTILDFGFARAMADEPTRRSRRRGGVTAFFEPELARAKRNGTSMPPASIEGEQYALAALLYLVFAGAPYLEFAADRHAAMRQIAEDPPRSFSRLGLAPFPELERVLGRALSKEPASRFASMGEFTLALREVPAGMGPPAHVGNGDGARPAGPSPALLEAILEHTRPGGMLGRAGSIGAPTANVNFGAAGVACALYRVALVRESPALLSLADVWATRAAHAIGSRGAFYNPRQGLSRRVIGPASLYHTASGVHVVRALIARAMGDFVSIQNAIAAFIAASRRPGAGVDLTLGRSGILLGCALLLEALPNDTLVEAEPLVAFGDGLCDTLWREVDALAPVGQPSALENLGIAHGWGGVLYARLRWQVARHAVRDDGVMGRLSQLAELAEPDGRGLRWRWIDQGRETRMVGYMPGWCNGSAGLVFLWLLARAAFDEPRYAELAAGAAWNAWEDDAEPSSDLCCGLAGRAYALLAMYRDTGDRDWLRRAVALASTANDTDVDDVSDAVPDCTSLYKSPLGAAVLAAELERPEAARMPLFESEGWPGRS